MSILLKSNKGQVSWIGLLLLQMLSFSWLIYFYELQLETISLKKECELYKCFKYLKEESSRYLQRVLVGNVKIKKIPSGTKRWQKEQLVAHQEFKSNLKNIMNNRNYECGKIVSGKLLFNWRDLPLEISSSGQFERAADKTVKIKAKEWIMAIETSVPTNTLSHSLFSDHNSRPGISINEQKTKRITGKIEWSINDSDEQLVTTSFKWIRDPLYGIDGQKVVDKTSRIDALK